ncbi:hypothetical protein ACVMIH_001711 [Bradyrhizobium sp. USDA 4503]
MKTHLFVSDSDGGLYDTRRPDWHKAAPLRAVYRRHFRAIRTAAEFKATLRAGAYAWPGGYPLAFLTTDGAALCFDCARSERRNVFWSIANRCNDGWRVMACDMIDSDDSEETTCDHCSKEIGSARQ